MTLPSESLIGMPYRPLFQRLSHEAEQVAPESLMTKIIVLIQGIKRLKAAQFSSQVVIH